MRFRKSSVALRSVILIVFLLSSSYFVVQVHASEPSLIEIFNYLGFTNMSETSVETFSAGTYNITLYAEFAGYCDENELSYYEVGTSIFHVIFTGPEGGSGHLSPPITKTFTTDYLFGLSMLSPGPHRYFSETSKNPDGEQHAKVYRNLDDPNMFLIGFENQYGAGDRDYNDMVFSLECAHDLTVSAGVGGTTSPVPETYSYACGSSVQVEAIPDSCYMFDHWMLDSVDVGSANPYTVLMDDDHSLHAVFAQIDYTLTITATAGGTTDPIPRLYSYACGSSLSVEAVPDSCYVFDHWELDSVNVGSANPYSVLMDDDHALYAVFAYSPPSLSVSISPPSSSIVIGDSVSFTSTLSGDAPPYSYQWYLDDAPVSGATSSSWTFTPPSTRTYYVYLKVTDVCNSTAQSETAKITVRPPSPPVGGHSVSLTKSFAKAPLICYTMLIAMFAAVMSLIRRKRK